MSLMHGKKGLIMGLANDHSLAWGITQQLHKAGAELAFTYMGNSLAKRVIPLAKEVGSDFTIPCDVSDSAQVEACFEAIREKWGELDFVVHAVGFSDKNELTGQFMNTSKKNFTMTMEISCFSFVEVCKYASPLMKNGGAFLTLTYLGGERVMPNYNVMGIAKAALEASVKYLAVDLGPQNIRVNAISAGPMKTLASSGIGDFRYILKWNQYNAPLRRNTTLEDVGGAGLYLLSQLSSGVTGEVHHVDSGYHVVGMKAVDAPDITVEMARGK